MEGILIPFLCGFSSGAVFGGMVVRAIWYHVESMRKTRQNLKTKKSQDLYDKFSDL